MYDWIEQTDWDDVLKLAQHMQLIPSVNISFIPGNGYDESQPRQDSRMTKFYELLGAITMNRSSLYHSINANDLCPSNASIKIVKNKKAILEYGLDKEDYGEFPEQIAPHRQADDARRQEADPDRTPPTEPTDPTLISNAFQIPLPDINKSLTGPQVISNWSFNIFRDYSSIKYSSM